LRNTLKKKRVVITGIGVISPIGIGKKEFVHSLKAGKSGVTPITLFDASQFPTRIAAEVKDFNPRRILNNRAKILEITDDRRVLFANCAAALAIEDAKLPEKKLRRIRGGVVFGAGVHPVVPATETIISQGIVYGSETEMRTLMKGQEESKTAPIWNRVSLGTLSVAQHYGIKGPCYTVVSACAASSQATGQSFKIIQRGEADLILTGGYDSMIFPFAIQGFCSLGTMSSRNEQPQQAMKPFDRNRDGFVLGEGAGVIILEEFEHALKRGAPIYAEMSGYGSSLDAYSVADPHPEGSGAVLSMENAIKDAGIEPLKIDYINAHGTATMKNDKIETAAIKKVFAAAGALELIATTLAMDNNFIPPTINYNTPDPACDLDYVPNRARDKSFYNALSNSFGFGGQNSTLIITRL
jgi:3-oxoacyl-[acyl-carrier-protein] synthase II